MRLIIVSIFDSKVGNYSPPMLYKTKGEAIRAFSDAVKDPSLPFSKHPGDYRLFELGHFDDNEGRFDQDIAPSPLIGADELGLGQ